MKTGKVKDQTQAQNPQNALRLKAGVILALTTILFRFILPAIIPAATSVGVLAGILGGIAILVWWAFFSRAQRTERWGAIAIIITALVLSSLILDDSISTAMQGMMFPSYALPVLCSVFVLWAWASRRLPNKLRWILMITSILLSSGVWALVRSEGITGHAKADFVWRWSDTHEDQLLSSSADGTAIHSAALALAESKAEWPGFRGPGRDGIAYGTTISRDWSSSPPSELWRKAIGPACSSFAVHGELIYTQEQLGEDEIVSCYHLPTGEAVWKHRDEARFWDSHAGAGPRSTPTLSNDRVYTFGATGILNALDARDGALIWKREVPMDKQIEIPGWGYCSSPLVCGDAVIVALAGTMLAYNTEDGELLWVGKEGGKGYSSPHLLSIDGTNQVLLMNDPGVVSLAPETGEVLWEYPWPHNERILQPALSENGDLLLCTGGSKGMCRLKVRKEDNAWSVEEVWKEVTLKSYFNDLVIHKNFAYGFSGPFLECFDMTTGEKMWKGKRYGGQLILLADQELIVVLSEKGELVLVKAAPEKFTELGKYPALEGKTWNHPVAVRDILLLRNSQEMVAIQL